MAQLTEALVRDILNGQGCTLWEVEQLCHFWLRKNQPTTPQPAQADTTPNIGVGVDVSVDGVAVTVVHREGAWDTVIYSEVHPLPATPAAHGVGGSLLRKAGEPLPAGCYCKPGKCMAPVVMGRQHPCRDPKKAASAPGGSDE